VIVQSKCRRDAVPRLFSDYKCNLRLFLPLDLSEKLSCTLLQALSLISIAMFFSTQTLSLLIATLSTLTAYTVVAAWLQGRRGAQIPINPHPLKTVVPMKKSFQHSAPPHGAQLAAAAAEEMRHHKNLYLKLHNLEHHPSILPCLRDLLISFLSEALNNSRRAPASDILRIESFEPESLAIFLKAEHDKIALRWEQYTARRRAGSPREMFADRAYAERWLRQHAPVKYVDGAWLGHIHKITTPFKYRGVTKIAWQIFSEELGDGDLDKNHAYIYRELMMNDVAAGLPDGDSAGFVHARQRLDEPQVWKGAVAQLLISLFPQEFLPEILGFNLHFEMLTWDTMRATKELKELKLNSFYFLLHVSIDNADSGHTAMAMNAVIDYIQLVHEADGTSAAHQAWRRVQAGFILSESLAGSAKTLDDTQTKRGQICDNPYEEEVMQIFQAKADVAHRLHCGSEMKINGRALVDWLDPEPFQSIQWRMEFLEALSNTRPWIYKGDSCRSRLIKEMCWNGKMFGSLTQTEVGMVKKWIDAFTSSTPDFRSYWSFVGKDEVPSEQVFQRQDICLDYPVLSAVQLPGAATTPTTPNLSNINIPIQIGLTPSLNKFLPLWFAHQCILESFITIPFKTANPAASAVLRVLRAQYGFAAESSIVAGMDEVRRFDSAGVVEMGLEMMQQAGLPEPGCLRDVVEGRESQFAIQLLHLSMRPMQNRAMLLGLAWAFSALHDALAASESFELLSPETKKNLGLIASRERAGLSVCLDELKSDEAQTAEFCKGFELGREEIEISFV
jgi:Iron-containing redox enzyme